MINIYCYFGNEIKYRHLMQNITSLIEKQRKQNRLNAKIKKSKIKVKN